MAGSARAANEGICAAYVGIKCRQFGFVGEALFHPCEGICVSAKAAPLAGRRCLVLDDEFLIALDIQQALEQAGAAEVICAANVESALTSVRDGRFDIAVLDLRLGRTGGNSLPVAAALQQIGTPFIFLTGMRGDAEHARSYPQAPVVEKPYDGLALLGALAKALDGG
jgi:DNA-binding NtrC family response regulator